MFFLLSAFWSDFFVANITKSNEILEHFVAINVITKCLDKDRNTA